VSGAVDGVELAGRTNLAHPRADSIHGPHGCLARRADLETLAHGRANGVLMHRLASRAGNTALSHSRARVCTASAPRAGPGTRMRITAWAACQAHSAAVRPAKNKNSQKSVP
jgi:hypothetical protein